MENNNKQIVDALVSEDIYTAKKLINESLFQKMGKALEDKLINFGPSIFNEGSKPDFLDLDKDGNKKESMKKAAKDAKHSQKDESVESEEDVLSEEFELELRSLIEEIEEETGTQLSEEEIMELAEELFDVLSEESKEDEEDDDEEDEDETPVAPKARKGFNPKNTGHDEY